MTYYVIETEQLRIGPLSEAERDALAAIWLDPANARIHPGETEEQVYRWVEDTASRWSTRPPTFLPLTPSSIVNSRVRACLRPAFARVNSRQSASSSGTFSTCVSGLRARRSA